MAKNNGLRKEFIEHIRNYEYDVVCGSTNTDFPEEFEIPRENTGTLKDQGDVGACVAEVIAQIAESFYHEEMSEGFAYGTLRKGTSKNSGMFVSTAMDLWKSLGTLPKKYFDILCEMPEMREVTSKFPDLSEIAAKYKLKSYVSIGISSNRDNSIKDALTKYGRGLVATSNDFFGESHCIVLTGWNDKNRTYKFKNSWGESYGDKGYGEIPKDEIYFVFVPLFEEIDVPFNDVSKDDWFYDDVKSMYFAGITKGTSDTTFEPNRPITRAEDAAKTNRLLKMIDERFDILNRVLTEKVKLMD